jgi:hypothetical protein
MKNSDRAFVVSAVFLVVGALAYCAVGWFGIPVPHYYPTEHAWKWANEPGVPSQGWFAAQAFALLAGGLAGALAHRVAGLRGAAGASLGPGAVRVVAVFTLLVLAGCMAYMMWHEFAKWGVIPSKDGESSSGMFVVPTTDGTANMGVRTHSGFQDGFVCSSAFMRLRKIWRMKNVKVFRESMIPSSAHSRLLPLPPEGGTTNGLHWRSTGNSELLESIGVPWMEGA